MTEHTIRCTVTRYSIEPLALVASILTGATHKVVEETTEETTSAELRRPLPPYTFVDGERVYLRPVESEPLYLYLGNSEASAPWEPLLARARAGKGWSAQSGRRPVCVDGRFGRRNYPEIQVSAEAILELERAMAGEKGYGVDLPTQQDMRQQLREWGSSLDTRDALDSTIAHAWVTVFNERQS